MSANTFLEIVVPTFNRAHILATTLRELIAAISTQEATMALRVIDNCSTDDTPSVVEPYVTKGLLTYQRNSSNIGAVRNIAKCIDTSQAQWVWVFGDDDHILVHSLPYLLSSLRELTRDTVFARALHAKVSDDGLIHYIDKQSDASASRIVRYSPGVHIARHGSIHDLAFISQLIINPACWNQEHHDSICRESDLYTFVLTLLNECTTKRAADINIHIAAATDRGDRSYYTPNVCIARLTEFTSYERLVHSVLGSGSARKALASGRKNLLKHRIASCFKLVASGDSCKIEGKDPMSFMLTYHSPYLSDVIAVRSLALAAKLPSARAAFNLVYNFLSRNSA